MEQIFGSLKGKSEVVSIFVKESDTRSDTQTIEAAEGVYPEWAEVLEPVRKLPTNVGARIKKCILEALERKPPESVRKILEHSISKEVYKGNASGPTKVILSHLCVFIYQLYFFPHNNKFLVPMWYVVLCTIMNKL